MIHNLLSKYNIILGSASPRRKELLQEIGLEFKIKTTDKDEKHPNDIDDNKIAEFLAKQKSSFLSEDLKDNELLITADTIVSFNNQLLHKPINKDSAFQTLSKLSGNTHKVITGVCIKTKQKEVVFSTTTKVIFNQISDKEINFYINNYNPFDKAGAYGIQDWIGQIGIKKIEGSYSNVVGLPTSELYEHLKSFV